MSREKKPRNQNLTIPNALSCMRILLVPFFAWCFLRGSLAWAAALLVLSGLTDMFDGLIARKCNQITELGKILDPFADKLTQGVVALCLAIKFPMIGPLLGLFIAKELLMLCCALVLLKKCRRPGGAKWYGKVATVMFYVSVSVIVVMDEPQTHICVLDRLNIPFTECFRLVEDFQHRKRTFWTKRRCFRFFKQALGPASNPTERSGANLRRGLFPFCADFWFP